MLLFDFASDIFPSRLKESILQPNVADLWKHVKTSKWMQLGTLLGVGSVKLEMIEKDHGDIDDKLHRMFRAWLEIERDPTWNKVVAALEGMELNVLASDIKDMFC